MLQEFWVKKSCANKSSNNALQKGQEQREQKERQK